MLENNKQIEAIKFCIQLNQALDAAKQPEPFDFKLKGKHNYTLLHLAWLNAFDKFFDLYLDGDYLASKISYEDRDKFFRRPWELVLYNSQYFKRLKRIEKKYCAWRLNWSKQDKVKSDYVHHLYGKNEESEGNIYDFLEETSPMINKRRSVNSLSISGTGKRHLFVLNYEYNASTKSFKAGKAELKNSYIQQVRKISLIPNKNFIRSELLSGALLRWREETNSRKVKVILTQPICVTIKLVSLSRHCE